MRIPLLILSISLSCLLLAATTPVKFRRICYSGNDNTLVWYKTTDTCTSFKKYYLWARNGTSGPFLLIDSIANKNTESYIHSGANAGSGTKKWYYFIQNTDLCGPILSAFSDTIPVDVEQLVQSFIDSVSVDHLTNKVIIGWHSNPAPDFAIYDPYRQDGPKTYTPLPSTRDTFISDNLSDSDPSIKALQYDLNTRDSCGNPGFFGQNPHTTILLTGLIDTCNKVCNLTWTPYIGWSAVRKYYLYKKEGAGTFLLIGSLDNTEFKVTNSITTGIQIQYYIRAIKDTTILVSSSSNIITFISRNREEPQRVILQNITSDPIKNSYIQLKINNIYNEEWLRFDIYRRAPYTNFDKIGSIINPKDNSTLFNYIDIKDPSLNKYEYTVKTVNVCDIEITQTVTSSNLLLRVTVDNPAGQNKLSWNNYYFWDTGVEKYRIYRGSNLASENILYEIIDSVSGNDSIFIDNGPPKELGNLGLCYYLQAIQNPGSLTGAIESSFSNHFCLVSDLLVFIPTAFCPNGVNRFFRPEGTSIDYKNSKMEIYDRWGGLVVSLLDITAGWDGKDNKGNLSMPGVYLYNIKISSTNGNEQTKTGTVTLIN